MLIPIARKVLKSINYLCEDNKCTSNIDVIVYLHNKTNNLDLPNTLLYLRDEGYITGDNLDGLWENIKPTYKGKHYNQFTWVSIKNFLIKSIITPIIVAFITSFITYSLFQ